MLPPLLLVTFSLVGLTSQAHPQQSGAQTHPAWLHQLDQDQREVDELPDLPPCSNGILQAPLPPLEPQAWHAGQDEHQQTTIPALRHDSSAKNDHLLPPLTQPPTGHAFAPAGTMHRTHYPTSLQQDANMVLRATCLARFRPLPRASPR